MEPTQDRLGLAEHYVDVGRPERALAELAELGSEGIDNPQAWFVRAYALLGLERYREAARAAGEGLALDADDVGLLHLLSLAEWKLGRLASAERAILAALELSPENPTLLCTYAHLVSSAGQLEKAERLVDEAARLDPEEPYVRRTRAELAYLGGRDAEAETHARHALELEPDDTHALALMGVAAYERGHARRGAKGMRRAASMDPSIEHHAESARSLAAATHPLLLPLWPIYRFGQGPVWLTGVALLLAVNFVAVPGVVAEIVILTWFAFVAYSWVAPPLVRRWLERRRP
jgi:tetratricopeptide (TPR) repeat protein